MPTHIQTGGWSFLPTPIQKQAALGSGLKEHHYSRLQNSLLMDQIFRVFSFLTSLPTSHFLDFLQKTFAFTNYVSLRPLLFYFLIVTLQSHALIVNLEECFPRSNASMQTPKYYSKYTTITQQGKKPKDNITQNKPIEDDEEPFNSLLSFAIQEKKKQKMMMRCICFYLLPWFHKKTRRWQQMLHLSLSFALVS